jgi:hypothetical protein
MLATVLQACSPRRFDLIARQRYHNGAACRGSACDAGAGQLSGAHAWKLDAWRYLYALTGSCMPLNAWLRHALDLCSARTGGKRHQPGRARPSAEQHPDTALPTITRVEHVCGSTALPRAALRAIVSSTRQTWARAVEVHPGGYRRAAQLECATWL